MELAASCLGVADLATRLGLGLRQLQQEFSGALEHVGNIAQQTGTIQVALYEICELVSRSPGTFPSSFTARLGESMDAVGEVAGQIQEHADSIREAAEKSPTTGRLLHLRHASKVAQWESNLGVQIQALSLLLQVAQLRSSSERASAMDQDSSKKVFEKASSMSARMGRSSHTSSSESPCSADVKHFSFDHLLLDTRVYRRACEVAWKRQVTSGGQELSDEELESSASISSSIDAVASQSGSSADEQPRVARAEHDSCSLAGNRPVDSTNSGVGMPADETDMVPGDAGGAGETTTSTSQDSEPSSYGDTEHTSSWDTNASTSTGVTTVSTVPATRLRVLVVLETIGEDHAELPPRCQDYYHAIWQVIAQVRECILISKGIDPMTYDCGTAKGTIETAGRDADRFPFTAAFLGAALEMLDKGFYTGIEIIVRYPNLPVSAGDPISSRVASSVHEASATVAPDRATSTAVSELISPGPGATLQPLSSADIYSALSGQLPASSGGFSKVYKVDISREHGGGPHGRPACFAVKRLLAGDREAFKRERDALARCCRDDPHIVKLLCSFEHSQGTSASFYLVFPWAECNLREFWKRRGNGIFGAQPPARNSLAMWVAEQCAGLATALANIHHAMNRPLEAGLHSLPQGAAENRPCGRHGDIKPENILWFPERATTHGTLRISDFGLAQFHCVATRCANPRITPMIACTPTYRPPESDSTVSNRPIGPAWDIWSLGCLYLEFMVWALEGWNGVRCFRQERHEHSEDDCFFTVDAGRGSTIKASVANRLGRLKRKALVVEPPMREGLVSLAGFAVGCLEVDDRRRLSAAVLAERLATLNTKLVITMASDQNTAHAEPG